jgi:hypothetical protein
LAEGVTPSSKEAIDQYKKEQKEGRKAQREADWNKKVDYWKSLPQRIKDLPAKIKALPSKLTSKKDKNAVETPAVNNNTEKENDPKQQD